MKFDAPTSQEYESPRQLWRESSEYLKSIGVIFVDKYVPYILCSIAAHVANLRNKMVDNKGHLFYGATGGVPDLRLHLLTIAPPGFSKTFFQNIFFNKYNGIAANFPNEELETLTEAGLVGSFDAEGNQQMGLAEEHKTSILWAEEFHAMSKMSKVDHSINLDTAFLKLLDDGKVGKRLKSGSIEFQSYCTLHAGTQNERLDLASGMTRRLFLIDATPEDKDLQKYKDAHKNSRGIKPNFDTIAKLRHQFSYLYNNLDIPGEIQFTSNYNDLAYNNKMTHVEVILFEKLAVGYNILNNFKYEDRDLIIDADSTLKTMFKEGWVWRNIMLGESTNIQIIKLLRTGDWTLFELKKRLQQLGVNYTESGKRINELLYREVIRTYKKGQDSPHKGRPAVWVTKGSEWMDYWLEEYGEAKDGISKQV